MSTKRNKYLLFNWLFIGGLLLLVVNDHYLKWQFSNWVTGKLSDFVGLFILPMLVLFIFPRLRTYAFVFCGLFFIIWKLPFSDVFISTYNEFSLIPIVRTVDYTDLVALMILPVSHFFVMNIDRYRILKRSTLSFSPFIVLIPSCLIFMATSPPISFYMKPNGDVHIGKSYKMKNGKEAFLSKLKEEGFSVRPDTSNSDAGRAQYYLLENLVLNNGKDTIKSIQFAFLGNLLLINNVNVNGDFRVSDWKELKRYAQHYEKLIKSEIIAEIR